jgi:hypothetical protein
LTKAKTSTNSDYRKAIAAGRRRLGLQAASPSDSGDGRFPSATRRDAAHDDRGLSKASPQRCATPHCKQTFLY